MRLLKLLNLLYIQYCTATIVGQQYWFIVSLQNIEWKNRCSKIIYSNEPKIKIILKNPENDDINMISWDLDSTFDSTSQRSFLSYWESIKPVKLIITMEVIGIDPTLKIQRIYGRTNPVLISSNLKESALVPQAETTTKLKGLCFDATVTIKRIIGHCPWIKPRTDFSDSKGLRGTNESTASITILGSFLLNPLLNILLFLFCFLIAFVIVISFAAFCYYLCWQDDKITKNKNILPKYNFIVRLQYDDGTGSLKEIILPAISSTKQEAECKSFLKFVKSTILSNQVQYKVKISSERFSRLV